MQRRVLAIASLVSLGAWASMTPTSASLRTDAVSTVAAPPVQVEGPPTTTTVAPESTTTTTTLDVLPPEVPPTQPSAQPTTPPTQSAPPTTKPVTPTTTAPRVDGGADPTLGPVCASARTPNPPITATPTTLAPASKEPKPCRIVAYYGTPLAPTMGILGRLPRDQMPTSLRADVAMWAEADPTVTTRCAFEIIAVVAQASPGKSGLYRARIASDPLNAMIALARTSGCITILDVQVGHSTVPAEVAALLPWLSEPDVHLGLDPEWDLPAGIVPGKRIGSMTADDINSAITSMSNAVRELGLPPKLVIVHRFQDAMVSNPEAVKATPEVRLLLNMDGFGGPSNKLGRYGVVRKGFTTSLAGFKLFTKNDTPMLRPADVLSLRPPPMFINYQ